MNDNAMLALGFNDKVRIYAANTTNLCEKARLTHGLWPTTAQILGRCLTTTALMSLMDKNHDTITVRIDADGPAGQITCEGKHGVVRGYLNNPEVFLHYNEQGLKVSDALGSGFINVTKQLNNGTFYTSTSPIVSGEIAEDFTYYFASSEQTPSVVGVAMVIETNNSVSAAGGFIIQLMPGATEEVISFLEQKLVTMKSCTQMIKENYTAKDMIIEIMGDEGVRFLEEYELSYGCSCSKERFNRGIATLGKEELTNILNEEEKIDITCNFCKEEYRFDSVEIQDIIDNL